jgi:hypothetical protein
MSGISNSQVSRRCEEIDDKVKVFLDRPIEGDWPYLWLDATYVKVRQAGRVVSAAVIVAVGVNSDGRREVLGMDIGPSEADGVDGPLPSTTVPEWRLSSTPRGGRPPCTSPRRASISPRWSVRKGQILPDPAGPVGPGAAPSAVGI